MKISVIGLGKLGLCTASCFAVNGTKVIGVDKNSEFISALQNKKCPIQETGLEEYIESAWQNLEATDDIEYAVKNSDISLIIVPTPSMENGRFTNKYLEVVLEAMAPAIKEKDSFHVVDVVSTVMPGSCENSFKPMLEKLTGKKCGVDFGLVYNPEFIALGSVLHNFLNPDMVLIGASDDKSSTMVKDLYASMAKSNPQYSIMSLTNAEITKLSLNCYVTMKISFANELGALCEKIPGADVDAVTSAIGADSRVGKKYLKSGLGFGGPCFPRDNIAFQACAQEFAYEAKLGPQVVAINKDVPKRIYNKVSSTAKPGTKVAVLGLSYKAGTHIVEESQAIMLVKKLLEKGYDVMLHDPQALETVKELLGEAVSCCSNVEDAINKSDLVVFMTSWPEYENLDHSLLRGKSIIDAWRIFKDANLEKYSCLGLGQS